MCGRYYRRSDKQKIAEAFRTGLPTTFEILPSYNVAPQTFQPVVCLNRKTLERELLQMRWGLVPYWAKDSKVAYSTINAKAETLTTSASFREAFKYRRCLIPMDGFYEWQPIDRKIKQPYAITLKDGAMFALAGLWDRWRDLKSGQELLSYTVITTDPNELLEPFHNRMPVILRPGDYERWMAPADPSRLPVDLLRPYPDELMAAWKVGQSVGNVKNDEPGLIAPID
ncbi:MAG TPA: SOS response-associated peptidase [Terracidiphilus sp.]|nr:SOS response-associated peptidase [Terracidiphilus sp.]